MVTVFNGEGIGSGVISSGGGLILTNEPVVRGAEKLEIGFADGQRIPGTVVATNPSPISRWRGGCFEPVVRPAVAGRRDNFRGGPLVLLVVQSMRGQRTFENIIIVLLAVIAGGFMTGLFISPPDPGQALQGLIPGFDGTATVLLAASMLGATVMPHAIYLHSVLARERHGYSEDLKQRQRLVRATRWDVIGALLVAGAVNIAMLLLAASSLRGTEGTDTIAGAHAAISQALGPVVEVIFGIGLLGSGLASTSVGCYAGATIMGGLLHMRIPLLLRRLITLIPALFILGAGIEPTWALVLSQVLLSFGIPFALIPLIRLTGNRQIMGVHVDSVPLRAASLVSAVLVVGLNCVLIVLTLSGQ